MITDSFRFIFLAAWTVLLMSACSSTEETAGNRETDVPENRAGYERSSRDLSLRSINHTVPLINHLRKIPGVSISSRGSDYTIIIRGYNFIDGRDENVLFVINNIPVGHSYIEAESMISMENVVEINVYKGSDALRKFGHRGIFGAVEIVTQ
ncbi:MAG: Plug domain-containing protein [Balneolaceae bacterium]